MNGQYPTGYRTANSLTPPFVNVHHFLNSQFPFNTRGTGLLAGIVKVARVPSARIVEVYDSEFSYFIAKTTSDSITGYWEISDLTTTRLLDIKVIGNIGENIVTIRGVQAS